MDNPEPIRSQILGLVKKAYQQEHAQKVFVPGESWINYAGRVFDEKEIQALVDSSLDFWLTLGSHGKKFEKKFAEYLGVRFCRLVNSGSSANLIALGALTSPLLGDKRIKPGSEVITVACGFPTTVTPIIQYQCVPVFVDVGLETKNIDVDQLDAALCEKTRCVMVAHTLGNPFDVDAVVKFCEKHNLFLIEDNCDALGSEFNGKKTGTFGHVATHSFYPAHHITMGEGGAIVTSDPIIDRAVASLRDWGRDCWCDSGKDNTCGKRFSSLHGELPQGYDHKYVYSHFGYNLKPLDLQAAIGCVQLDRLPDFVKLRKHNFARFYTALKKYETDFILPKATDNSSPSWFGFPLTVRDNKFFTREDIVLYLEDHKIQTRMLFGGNLIKQPLFDEMRAGSCGYRMVGDLPNTDIIMEKTFWIGVYPGLTDEQINYIILTFENFFAEKYGGINT